jgi:hypothetical protein
MNPIFSFCFGTLERIGPYYWTRGLENHGPEDYRAKPRMRIRRLADLDALQV